MKPIKLEIEGLNSFEAKQTLDFSMLGSGVFGIFGKTGSGKSTILDAITLSLYGKVERSKQNLDFINTKVKKTLVSLKFEIFSGGKSKIFEVTRTFTPKRNGKEVESSAELCEEVDGKMTLIVEGVTKVDDKIFSIIGLGENEFSKCIALPQGEFSAFLKARQAERTEIMSNIFDLSKYGEELAVKVKQRLAGYDKQVAEAEAALAIVDYASDELLKSTEERFNFTSNAYKQAKLSLDEKTEKYSALLSSLEKQERAEKLKEKLKQLEDKESEMNVLLASVEKNQAANLVRSDYEKLKKTKDDERELSEKIAALNEQKLKVSAEVAAVSADFDEFRLTQAGKLAELNSKLARLDELKSYENQEVELTEQGEKVQEEIFATKEKLTEMQDELAYTLSDLDKLTEEIDKIDEFIEANRPDVNLSYALEQTKGIESELILIDDMYEKVERLVDQTQEDLNAVQEEYNSATAEEKSLLEKQAKIQSSIEVAFEDADTTNFKKLRSADSELSGMQEARAMAEKLDEIIARLEAEAEEESGEIESLEREIVLSQNDLTGVEKKISDLNISINRKRELREETLGDNFFAVVSNHIKIGEHCPICNSKVIEKNYTQFVDIKSITDNINSEINDVKVLGFERDKSLSKLVELKTLVENKKTQIQAKISEISALKLQKQELFQKFVDNTDTIEEDFSELYLLIKNAVENLEKLVLLQDELKASTEQTLILKIQSGTKLSIYKNYLESLIDVLYDLQKKKAEREFAIYNIGEKYKNLSEYKKQIAEGKNIEIVIDEKKEEKCKLREDQFKVTTEKSKIEAEISSLSVKLGVLDEKYLNLKKQILQTRGKIMENGVPEGVLVSEEQRVVKEAMARLQFDSEQKELALTSAKDLLSRTENEYNVNFSILASKRGEISELEKQVNLALQSGEFASSEELENCFISPSELKIRQNTLSDYNSELKLTKLQLEELGLETGPILEDDVKALKTEIDDLTEKTHRLSEAVGRQDAEFAKIKEDNVRRNQLLSDLAISRKNLDLARELSNVLKGKALAEYVAEEYLEEITASANQKLGLLMDGKYNLVFKDKEFFVEDNLSDGELRSAGTLSGGETFLVSLSLAFAISEAITMMSSRNMEFFFLDEGFGTLDDELCSTVISALYKLESQSLNIGLISHVSDLEESIKNRVYVEKLASGSKIKIVKSL